jgi:hypothetical protein
MRTLQQPKHFGPEMKRDLHDQMTRATLLEWGFAPCPIRAQRDRLVSGRLAMG